MLRTAQLWWQVVAVCEVVALQADEARPRLHCAKPGLQSGPAPAHVTIHVFGHVL